MIEHSLLIVAPSPAAAADFLPRLEALGVAVCGVVTGDQEAESAMRELSPDVVLLDERGPGNASSVTRAETLRAIRRVAIVRIVDEPARARAARRTANEPFEVLSTPFSNAELDSAIELAICRDDSSALEDRFFALSVDMLCFLDFDGRFRRLNPAWERALGYTLGEMISLPFIDFVHPDDRERTLAQNSLVQTGEQALGFENRYRCKDGSYRWLLWNAAPDVGQRVIYSVARDVTERKQAEAERELLLFELQQSHTEVKALRAILPICSYCRRVRDDDNYWDSVESYVSKNTETKFSHGICPSCMETVVEKEFRSLPGDTGVA